MNDDARRAALAELVGGPVGPARLGRACLAIAQGESPDLDVDTCIATIRRLADETRPTLEAGAAPWGALQAVLGVAAGFRGDAENYDAPENSYLDRVLARRRGLPIMLSVVWIEVATTMRVSLMSCQRPGQVADVAVLALRVGRHELHRSREGQPPSSIRVSDGLERHPPQKGGPTDHAAVLGEHAGTGKPWRRSREAVPTSGTNVRR